MMARRPGDPRGWRGYYATERAFHCGRVPRECVEAVLDGDHVMPIGLQARGSPC